MFRFSVLASLLVLTLLTWFGLPQTTSQILLALNNKVANLSSKSIETSIGPVQYLEGGDDLKNAETIVLLHGIFARKEHWIDVARELVPYYRVIALDLPGFGDNPQLTFEQYRLHNQKQNLIEVLAALEIERAHFGANSMGAAIMGLLAEEKPEVFSSLAFIGSPLGVDGKVKSEMEIAIMNGNIPLLVKSEQDFRDRNSWLFPQTPRIPSPILKTWMQQEVQAAEHNTKIWFAANSFAGTQKLQNLAHNFFAPSLIIWCQEDRIFHVSGAKKLHAMLPNSRLEILNNCGHVPMLDKPNEVANLYLQFLSSIE